MPYTTQGFMTAADMAEVRRDMDLDLCEPATINSLAAEFDCQPHEVVAFGNLGSIPDMDYNEPLDGDDEQAIREAWDTQGDGPEE